MATLTRLYGASPLNADDATRLAFTNDFDGTQSVALDNIADADFKSMLTLSWLIQARVANAGGDDTYRLLVRIVNDPDGTPTYLAGADSSGGYTEVVANLNGVTTDTNYGPTAFAYVNTSAAKSLWDGAVIQLWQNYSQNKGKDGNHIEIDLAYFDGTYTPGYEATGGEALGGITLSASGTSAKPAYSATGGITLGGITLSGSGTFVDTTVTRTVSRYTQANYLGEPIEVYGSFNRSSNAFTATASFALGGVTFAGSGTSAVPAYSATGNEALGGITLSASGTAAVPAYTATGAVALGGIVPVVTGTLYNPANPVFTITGMLNTAKVEVTYTPTNGLLYGGYAEVEVDGTYYRAPPLYQSEGVAALYTTVFGLESGQTYNVRTTFEVRDPTLASSWLITENGIADTGFDVLYSQQNVTGTTLKTGEPVFKVSRTSLYINTVTGSDSNDGLSVGQAVASWNKIETLITNGLGGYDIYYVGKCNFPTDAFVTNISGASDDWNSIRPYDSNAELNGYTELTPSWTNEGDGVWSCSTSLPIGRVAYDRSGVETILWPCKALDGANNYAAGSDPVALALMNTSSVGKANGTISNVTRLTSPNRWEITTSAAHGLATDDWVRLVDIVGEFREAWKEELHKLHKITVTATDKFTVLSASSANFRGSYQSGGEWETQRIQQGFHWDSVANKLYVRLYGDATPTTVKVAHLNYPLGLGSGGVGVDYMYLDLRLGLAGKWRDKSGSIERYCETVSDIGHVRLIDCNHIIITGTSAGPGIWLDQVNPCADIIIKDWTKVTKRNWLFMRGDGSDADETFWDSTPITKFYQEHSWRFIQHSLAAQPGVIYIQGGERLILKNVSIEDSNTGVYIGATGSNIIKNVDCDNVTVKYAEDPFEFEGGDDRNIAVFNSHTQDADNLASMAPENTGPIFIVNNYAINNHISGWVKIGVGSATVGKTFCIVANNTFHTSREADQWNSSTIHFQTIVGGIVAVNNLVVTYSSPDISGLFDGGRGCDDLGRINYFNNNIYYQQPYGDRGNINVTASSQNVITGSVASGSLTSTYVRDGTSEILRAASGLLNVELTFNVGAGNKARNFFMFGRGSSTNPGTNIQVYNTNTTGWETLVTLKDSTAALKIGSRLTSNDYTAANGDVKLRFYSTAGSPSTFDVLVDYIAVNQLEINWTTNAGTISYYQSFADLTAARGADEVYVASMVLNNEIPFNTTTGQALTAYRDSGIDFLGITNIASYDGYRNTDVPIGYFGYFTYIGYQAVGAVTLGGVTFSGSGTSAVPAYTATSNFTLGGITLSGSGTSTVPAYTSTSAFALGGVTLAGVGFYSTFPFTATAAVDLGGITLAGSGTSAVPTYSATSAFNLGGITLAGVGVTSFAHTATGNEVLGGIVLAGSGTSTAPAYSATSSFLLGGITLAGTGTATIPAYTATVNFSLGGIVLVGAGTSTVPAYSATGNESLGGIVLAAAGLSTIPAYTATGGILLGGVTFNIVGSYLSGSVFIASGNLQLAGIKFESGVGYAEPAFQGSIYAALYHQFNIDN